MLFGRYDRRREVVVTDPPLPPDEERRFRLRYELDAVLFRFYDLPRNDGTYLLDTFPIVRRNDEKRFGSFRTKDSILAIFHEMSR